MKILVFGSLNIDLTFSLDHIVRPGETISSTALNRGAGGKGANQAAALAKAGADVYMAGKIGADGEFLTELLQSYGVDTSCVARYEGATGQAIIQLEKSGQNSIVLFAGGNGAISSAEITSTLDRFGSGDSVLLQNEIVRTGEIMERAKARGMKLYLNPSPFDGKIAELPLDAVDCFFVNEIEGAALAESGGGASLPELINGLTRRFPRAEIILTAGKDGAYYGCGDFRAKGEVVDLPVLDTVGAGDTFTGFFIAARGRSWSVEASLDIACKAASIAVSRKGAMEAMPLWDEAAAQSSGDKP
jgi:ribokinase